MRSGEIGDRLLEQDAEPEIVSGSSTARGVAKRIGKHISDHAVLECNNEDVVGTDSVVHW